MQEDQLPTAGGVLHAIASDSADVSGTAFDAVYETYRPLLRKIAMRHFKVPAADADTLIHDVFATYFAHQERVRELHPYLIGGICNASRQYWREHDRERAMFADAEVCSLVADDHLLEALPETLLVRSALGRLGTSCRETLHRFYIDGESASSIAASRDTTQNSILRLLHYCRERARAAYQTLNEATHRRGPSK